MKLTVNSVEWRAADDPRRVAAAIVELLIVLEHIAAHNNYQGDSARNALARFEWAILEK